MCIVERCVLAIGLWLSVLGFTFLAITLSEVLPRYLWADDFKEAQCSITNQVFNGNICCTTTSSDSIIWSTNSCSGVPYPCYGVLVSYNKVDGTAETGTLFGGYEDVKYQGDNLTVSSYSKYVAICFSHFVRCV